MSALDTQVGGDHYKDQKIQPIELAYMLLGTPAFCKVAKYCTRDKGDLLLNLNKAMHCIQLEAELREYAVQYHSSEIPCKHLINMFTDEKWLRVALFAMHNQRYAQAHSAIEEHINAIK